MNTGILRKSLPYCIVGLMLLPNPDAFAWFTKKKASASHDHRVENLYYGQALYEFHLNQPLDALTQLEIAKKRKPDTEDSIRSYPYPEIFNTSLSLGYGLTQKASDQLANLRAYELPIPAQTQMNFLLAKHAYYRGAYAQSLEAIEQIPDDSSSPLLDEALYFKAQIFLKKGQTNEVLLARAGLSVNSPWKPYIDYNLALIASDVAVENKEMSIAWDPLYEQLENQIALNPEGPHQPELSALLERATITQALLQTQKVHTQIGQNTDKALGVQLAAISSTSPWLDSGLFTTGLHALSYPDSDTSNPYSTQAWNQLLRLPLDSYEKDSARLLLLSTSSAFTRDIDTDLSEKKDQLPPLLIAYDQAIQHFKRQIEQVETRLSAQDFDTWYQTWAQGFIYEQKNELPTDNMAWIRWLSQQDIRKLVVELKEVTNLNLKLKDWAERLPFILLAIETRETAQKKRLAEVSYDQITQVYQAYVATYQKLLPTLENITQQETPWVMADEETRALNQMIEKNRKRVESLSKANLLTDEETTAALKTLNAGQGLLIWQLEMERPELRWQNKKKLILVKRKMDEIRTRINKIQRLLSDNQPFEASYQYLTQLQQRMDILYPTIRGTQMRLEAQLATEVKLELMAQAERAKTYLSFATYERARIYDQHWQSVTAESEQISEEAQP